MIEEIIEKISCYGYDELTQREKFLFDKYESELE